MGCNAGAARTPRSAASMAHLGRRGSSGGVVADHGGLVLGQVDAANLAGAPAAGDRRRSAAGSTQAPRRRGHGRLAPPGPRGFFSHGEAPWLKSWRYTTTAPDNSGSGARLAMATSWRILSSSVARHRQPPLTAEQDQALATAPVDEMLELPFINDDTIPNSVRAYEFPSGPTTCGCRVSPCSGVRWARANSISPGVILTPLAQTELNSARGWVINSVGVRGLSAVGRQRGWLLTG